MLTKLYLCFINESNIRNWSWIITMFWMISLIHHLAIVLSNQTITKACWFIVKILNCIIISSSPVHTVRSSALDKCDWDTNNARAYCWFSLLKYFERAIVFVYGKSKVWKWFSILLVFHDLSAFQLCIECAWARKYMQLRFFL